MSPYTRPYAQVAALPSHLRRQTVLTGGTALVHSAAMASQPSRARRTKPPRTPEQRATAARIAALTRHGTGNPAVHTQPARDGFLDRFVEQARNAAEAKGESPPPDEDELTRRARLLRRAYMQGLAYTSSRRRQAAQKGADVEDAAS